MGLGIVIKVNGSPDNDLVQANKVEIYERMGETTYYSISYPEDIINGDMPKLIDSRFGPGSVLSIIGGVDDSSLQCLVKGPVYSQQIHLEHGGEGSTVEVRGADTAITMDREIKSVVWTDVTDGDTVTNITAGYGLTADVATTKTTHLENKHSLVQRETDLRFIRRLARKNGCYFWITSDNNGIETAHFQRPQLDGDPAGDLIINFDNPAIQQLDIHWDVERPTSVEGSQIDLGSLDNLDGDVSQTPQTILGAQKLLDITGDTRTMQVSSPADDAAEMQAKSEGALIEADWFIRASCTTNVNVLGWMVRANTVVNVKGAGSRHSGKYLVSAVRHIIDAADHKMEIELVRNGWGSAASAGVAGKIF